MSDAGDIETKGKLFRAALPDAKYRRLFDQYIRSKSNPAVCANPDKLMTREDAILSAITYYAAKFDIEYKDETPLKDNEMDAFVKPAAGAGDGSKAVTAAKKPGRKPAAGDGSKTTPAAKKPSAATSDDSKAAPATKKPGRKPAASAAAAAPANLVATILEKEMERLTVEDVEIVRVTSFEHAGRKYYRDEKKGKIYATGPKGAVGGYIGRWNHRTETIETDIPDSDAGEE